MCAIAPSTGTNVLLCHNIAAIGLISANARIRNTSNRIVFIDEFSVLVWKLLSFTYYFKVGIKKIHRF